jgi:catechol 2,3-dioxygenase-like lactoylglutathione lyase family enzyme
LRARFFILPGATNRMSQQQFGEPVVLHNAIAHLVIGVRDLAAALTLWVQTFGLEIRARRDGPDPGLARLWDLDAGRISAQALLGTPGWEVGCLHLIEFANPAPPVRQGAQPIDLVPKNIDLVCDDLQRRYAELTRAGHQFRSAPARYEAEEQGELLEIFEALLPVHDAINAVLLQLVGRRFPFTSRGFAGFSSFVPVVPDAEAETRFYQEVLGLPLHFIHRLAGPHIERMIGLPPGGAVEMRMLGAAEIHAGRIELACYHGARGENRYPLAKPPALGTLHAVFFSTALDEIARRAEVAGAPMRRHPRIETIFGAGPVLTLHTPAGLRLDIHQI